MSSTRNLPSRSERHGDTALISRTPEEAPGTGGMTVASATRATSPRMATLNKKYNNLLANLATSMAQGLKAKPHPRPAFTTLARSISGRRSMTACIIKARRRDHPDRYHDDDNNDRFPSFTSNITEKSYPKELNQSESPSMTASRTRTSGSDATPLPSRSQGDPTPQKHSTSR
jgi:hypothetical protein